MKIVHPAAAVLASLCCKLLCSACLLLVAENEIVLSTIVFALSVAAAMFGAWFLDATLGFPMVRTVALMMRIRTSDAPSNGEAR